MDDATPEVELRGITKRFPGVLANDHIDLQVASGEIHALMGENGAGKSVLMSMLAGVYRPDEGEILVRGQRREFHSPLDAINAGIGMVFQAFKLFPSLSIADNVVFRAEPTKRGLLDRKKAQDEVAAIAERYGLAVDPTARVDESSVGVLQRVEIIKALYRDARILVLDEPTAVLTPQEAERLFDVLRALRADGRTIIFITHKLKEVMGLSDRITVLRDGQVTARLITAQTTAQEITRNMTGRDVVMAPLPASPTVGAAALQVRGLSAVGDDGRRALESVDLDVRAGEILGIAGVAGNGQTELAQVIAGLRAATAGSVEIAGQDVTRASVAARRHAGLAYVPEDRHATGTAAAADAAANLSMGHHRHPPILQRHLVKRSRMVAYAARLIEQFGIKVASPATKVGTLSGGNLQKIVVARELDFASPLLIAEQPTRGVDIGAIEFIHQALIDYRDGGGAVLLISADLAEVMRLSTRIAVMFEGRVVAQLHADQATEERLGLLMAGASETEGTA